MAPANPTRIGSSQRIATIHSPRPIGESANVHVSRVGTQCSRGSRLRNRDTADRVSRAKPPTAKRRGGHTSTHLDGLAKVHRGISQRRSTEGVAEGAVGEEAAGQVHGLVRSSLDERNQRVKIGLLPLRGVREQWEAAIARAKVPREAFEIEVGCPGGALWRLETGTDPSKTFRRAIDYSVEVVSQADYGETVSIALTLKNVSYEPVRFVTAGIPPHDFVITNGSGRRGLELEVREIHHDAFEHGKLATGRGAGVRRRMGAGKQPGRTRPGRNLPDQGCAQHGDTRKTFDSAPRAAGDQVIPAGLVGLTPMETFVVWDGSAVSADRDAAIVVMPPVSSYAISWDSACR